MRKLENGLLFGPLHDRWVHLCIDMQRMFAEPTEWHTPWMGRVLPNVVSLTELNPARTIFTRFIPPPSADDVGGSWKRYYNKWESMTRNRLDPELLELVPDLSRFVPPAAVEDKRVMSAWHGALHPRLRAAGVDALIVSGAETEVCVLATVMGAIDLGYRVIIVADAICSGADTTHDAMLEIYESRFGTQVEMVTTSTLLAAHLDGML
ncbi:MULTISPECIES: isochorismatase family cysteine hydrolase [unclassified Chelatococcus]|uniref:cysteine hydrolase family protein n=1 Tax=unclassified Chelatococcus TaxID=2638111 RepID=UPI0025BC6BCA|nr:isochorismatase family cysteine hydrolase [Chelatococcus sp.]